MPAVSRLVAYGQCAIYLGRSPAERWRIFWRMTKNARARLGLATYQPDLVYPLPTRHGRVFLRDNFGDVTNLPDLLCRSVYRVDRLADEGIVLDIGANIGLFAAWIARHNPERRIYCFEPLESNARLIALNCPAARAVGVGLGRSRRRARLSVDDHRLMASSVPTAWRTHQEEFDVVPLDDFARHENLGRVAFMKIDTEGMEVEVLEGGRATLGRTARVAMETHSRELHRRSIDLLRSAGLRLEAEEFGGGTGLVFAARSSAGSGR